MDQQNLGLHAENLTLRRKHKANQEDIIKKWWYVVYGDRSNLKKNGQMLLL